MKRDPYFDMVTDEQLLGELSDRGTTLDFARSTNLTNEALIKELTRRNLLTFMVQQVFVDGVVLRDALVPLDVTRKARAQAVNEITKLIVSQGVISFEEFPAGDDYAPGSTIYRATLGVLR